MLNIVFTFVVSRHGIWRVENFEYQDRAQTNLKYDKKMMIND